MEHKTYRFRRFAAFAIDWNLCCLPCLLICGALYPLVAVGKLPIPVLIPFMISFPVLFLFRERLFKGRSPGKRLMKLVILDRRTLQPLPASALTTRNMMLLLLNGLEGLMLLATGSTLGDRAVASMVVHQDEIPTEPPRKEAANTKSILVTVLAVIVAIALLISIVLVALESVKDEPHYALAYSYLVNSESFGLLDANPEQVRFTGYEKNTSLTNGVQEITATFTFQVRDRIFIVVCHETETGWSVCRECTKFQ